MPLSASRTALWRVFLAGRREASAGGFMPDGLTRAPGGFAGVSRSGGISPPVANASNR
jgi:hypothetical protein